MKMGPVDAGPESIESVRRQLQGTWALMALDVFSPAGEKLAVEAAGQLQYDEFGNMSIRGNITGGTQVDSSVLNLSGRVVIDPVTHTLRIQSVTAETLDDKRLDPQLDARHIRHYELTGDLLKMTIKAADGSTTAATTWRKVG